MKKKIAAVVLGLVVVLLFGAIHHRSIGSLNIPSEVSANWCSGGSGCQQPGNTACNQTPWQNTAYSTITASTSSPSLGTNCTHHVVSSVTAAIFDSTEGCTQAVYVEDGSTIIWSALIGGTSTNPGLQTISEVFPVTSFLHNNTDGTQTLVLLGLGPFTSGLATLTFGGHCSNSQEYVTINGFDQ